MKKILVLHTGGTISMSENDQGQVLPESSHPLMKQVFKPDNITITAIEIFHLPSPHMTPKHMLQLYQFIRQEAAHFDGIVITHGTDTLEETAYFLDTLTLPIIPIVITGAMRSSNELGSDGIYNFLTALRVAAESKSADKGVLVVMNDEIHAAKYVTKTHTTNVSTFQTPTHGPIGLITKKDILFFQQAEARVRFDLQDIQGTVPIIMAYAGMEDTFLSMIDPHQISGLVIEAMGAGNLPPHTCPAIEQIIKAGIPVVLVSRCFNGIAEPVYAYKGGGVQLKEMGVLFVKELNAQKARLKLLIALNAGLTGDALKEYIEG
ncbi:asparaginase [Streptococcus cameli]